MEALGPCLGYLKSIVHTAAPLVHEVQPSTSTVSQSCVRVQIPVLPSKVKNMHPAVATQMSWQLTKSVAMSLVSEVPWHRPAFGHIKGNNAFGAGDGWMRGDPFITVLLMVGGLTQKPSLVAINLSKEGCVIS